MNVSGMARILIIQGSAFHAKNETREIIHIMI